MTRRLLLSYVTITVLVLIILEVPLGFAFARSERRNLETGIEHDAFALASRAEDVLEGHAPGSPPPAALQDLAVRYQHSKGGRVVIVDRAGTLLADSDPLSVAPTAPGAAPRNFASRPEIASALHGSEAVGTRSSSTLGTDLLYVALPAASGGQILGAVRITYPLSFVSSRVRHNWFLLAGVGGAVLLAVLAASLVLSRSLAKPILDLEHSADELGRGDLSARADVPRGPHELESLARSFNRTASRLEQLVGAQESFVADASHQLRAPLAALRLRLENLTSEDPEQGFDDLDGALDEAGRLSELVDTLLFLARAQQYGSNPAPVDVPEVLAARRDAWSALADERGVRLELRAEPAVALATPGRLEQVLDNLLNNALEVAPRGSAIRIGAEPSGGVVVLRVTDSGPGMTAEQRARAFDRFWRGNGQQGTDGGGFGLGLAIVHQLVVADGGEVTLDPSPDGGLVVTVRLPRSAVPDVVPTSAPR